MLQLPKVVDVMRTFGNGELDPILLKNVKVRKVHSISDCFTVYLNISSYLLCKVIR